MDSRRLQAFLAVVDAGTVTAAAAALHVSQPALSQTLKQLEQEVGTELFHRIGRRLVLTAAGEALVAPARQVVRDVDVAARAVADVAAVEGGTLDVVVLPTLAVEPAARLLGAFRQEHPAVQVRLADSDTTGDALDRVADGRAEVALTDAEHATGLVVRRLGEQAYRAVFPPGGAPGRGRVPVSALADLPMVTTPPGTSTRRMLERAGVPLAIAVEAGPREAIVPLVLAGAGATLLPAPLAAEAGRAGADVRDIDPPLSRSVTLAHRDAPLSPAAAAFVAGAVGR